MARGVATLGRISYVHFILWKYLLLVHTTLPLARDRRKISQDLSGNLRAPCFEVKVFTKTEKNWRRASGVKRSLQRTRSSSSGCVSSLAKLSLLCDCWRLFFRIIMYMILIRYKWLEPIKMIIFFYNVRNLENLQFFCFWINNIFEKKNKYKNLNKFFTRCAFNKSTNREKMNRRKESTCESYDETSSGLRLSNILYA